MTDSREIIAQYLCDRAGQGWSGVSTFERAAYRTAAHGMIATLAAAGFRILGPDEVDPVTVERAAKVAESHMLEADDNEEPGDDDWWTRSAANGQATVIAAAIRALASGESR